MAKTNMKNRELKQLSDLAAEAQDAFHLANYYDGNGFSGMKAEQMEIGTKAIQQINAILSPNIDFIQSEIMQENNVNRWLQDKFNAAGKGMD